MLGKGFSVVVATVMLVAVAITLSVVAYLWGVGLLSNSLEGSDISRVTGKANISIDSVDYSNDVVYVRCKEAATQLQTIYVIIPSTKAVTRVDINSRVDTRCETSDKNVLDINVRTSSSDITSTGVDINSGYTVEIRGTNDAYAVETA